MNSRQTELQHRQEQYRWERATPEEREKIAVAAYVQFLWPSREASNNIG
jgi:hypothetical protein